MINWLGLMAWIHIIGGLLLPISMQFPFFVKIAQSALENTPAENGVAFWLGVFGPTVASWGVLFLLLLKEFEATQSIYLWRGMIASVLVWGICDTSFCMTLGVYLALPVNISAMMLLIVPLVILKREIKK